MNQNIIINKLKKIKDFFSYWIKTVIAISTDNGEQHVLHII